MLAKINNENNYNYFKFHLNYGVWKKRKKLTINKDWAMWDYRRISEGKKEGIQLII